MGKFSSEARSRIGNAIVYIVSNCSSPSKTKILKLLYLMEEEMVRRFGVPFLGLNYEVWRHGPVQKDIFADLSDDLFLFGDFIESRISADSVEYTATAVFDEDFFSAAEIKVMEDVVKKYGKNTASRLVCVTHKEDSLWHKAASENGLLRDFENGTRTNSDIHIDFSALLDDSRKEFYKESLEIMEGLNSLKASANV